MGFTLWCLFLVLLMSAALALIGLGMDWLRELTPFTLYAAFMAASLLGLCLAAIFVWPWVVFRGERLALFGLLYLGWRLSYFPLLQLSCLATGWAAGFFIRLPLVQPAIYPVFLPLLGLAHLAAGLLVVLPLATRRPLLALVAWPPLLLAGVSSFCDWEDVHPLPDRGYACRATISELPPAPTLDGILRRPSPLAWNERFRLWLAGCVYAHRDSSPWSTVVQGTLARNLAREGAADAAPQPRRVSTTRFVQWYYSALVAAQDFVGSERLIVRDIERGGSRGAGPRGDPEEREPIAADVGRLNWSETAVPATMWAFH
jgi:hypothetical protein